ncbi:hypothetical protein MTR67_037600, partial [Solanum verrucosum]
MTPGTWHNKFCGRSRDGGQEILACSGGAPRQVVYQLPRRLMRAAGSHYTSGRKRKQDLKRRHRSCRASKNLLGQRILWSLDPRAKELNNVEKEYDYRQIQTVSMAKHVETVVDNL